MQCADGRCVKPLDIRDDICSLWRYGGDEEPGRVYPSCSSNVHASGDPCLVGNQQGDREREAGGAQACWPVVKDDVESYCYLYSDDDKDGVTETYVLLTFETYPWDRTVEYLEQIGSE